ncbi:hypothetical protein BASA81_006162 [Batrachochytrium salamandrivorans]|nr:hypothetical protein BASA81_006162 [Batrachochytrium salamandrivorans]
MSASIVQGEHRPSPELLPGEEEDKALREAIHKQPLGAATTLENTGTDEEELKGPVAPIQTEEQLQATTLPPLVPPETAAAAASPTPSTATKANGHVQPVAPQKASQYSLGQTESLKNQRSNHEWAFGAGITCLQVGDMVNFNGSNIVPKSIFVTMLFREAVLDFSRAQFVHPETSINIFAIAGLVRVTIPRGVRLVTNGLAVCGNFGGQQSGVDANNPELDAPVIQLHGLSFCSSSTFEINYQVPVLEILRPENDSTAKFQEIQSV